MTTPSFPSYAKILLAGYQQQRESALLRSEMESGPARQSKVRSRVMITRTCTIFLGSLTDYNAFETWYATTLGEGSAWFDYTDPVSGITKSARFVGGGYTATPSAAGIGSWQVSAKIESWGS